MEKHEVVIVGAGPAGLKVAQTLAECGKKDVLVLEKLPEDRIGDKVCAGALTPKTMRELRPPEDILDVKTYDFIIHLPKDDVIIRDKDIGKLYMPMVTRHKLGQWQMKTALDAGAEIRGNSRISKINVNNKTLLVNDTIEIGYNILIGADGSNSVVRKTLNLKNKGWICTNNNVPGDYNDMEWFIDSSQFGISVPYIFPHRHYGAFGINIFESNIPPNSEKVSRFNKICKEKYGIIPSEYEGGAKLINSNYQGYRFGNIYLVGDAGGFASPLHAEGIFWAVRSGRLVAKEIIGENVKTEMKEFLRMHKKHKAMISMSNFYTILPKKVRVKILKNLMDTPTSLQKLAMRLIIGVGWPNFAEA